MDKEFSKDIQSLIQTYESLVKTVNAKAKKTGGRAYGGVVRAEKGKFVENLAESLIKIAWKELGREPTRLSFEKGVIKIPINKEYIERVKEDELKEYIKTHIHEFYYPLKIDLQVYVDREFKIAVECKAYTENAMLKRILVDFTLLKQVFPALAFVLFQLESQLGGNYSTVAPKYGSPSTHVLLSHFDVDLHIITLLEGERKVDRPIHKPQFYKPMRPERLLAALEVLKKLLN